MMAKVGTGRYKQMRSMCAITFVSVVLVRCSFSFSSLKPLASKDQQTQTRLQENDAGSNHWEIGRRFKWVKPHLYLYQSHCWLWSRWFLHVLRYLLFDVGDSNEINYHTDNLDSKAEPGQRSLSPKKKFNEVELEAIFILPKMMSSVAKSQTCNTF